jgi:gliding motility-associated-like protein
MKKNLLSIVFLLYSVLSFAQTDTLFWFAAPEVSIDGANFDRPILLRITTSGQAATVTISQPAGGGMPTQVVNIPAGSTQTVDLTTWIDIIENKPANSILNYGLKIQSNTPVTAYYEVLSAQCQCNPEIFVLKGQSALGADFWIPSQNYLDNNPGYNPVPYSAFDIVATQNNTTISITPSNNIVGHTAGANFTVTLNQGQTFSSTAASGLAAVHLQGSRVTSDKPIAITVKDDLLNGAPFGGCSDLGGDQIVPIGLLGTEYIAMKGFLNAPGDQVFVMAIQNGTSITQDGVAVTTINAGQTYQLSIPGAATYIQSSAPVYVLQLSGFGCEIGIDILPPIICTGSFDVAFTRSTTEDMFINVMVRSGGEGNFLVNGSPAVITAGAFTAVPGTGGQWLSAQISLPVGSYPQGTAINVSNSSSLFHLGLIHGGVGSGCRFGYFSNFARIDVNAQANAATVCQGSGIQLTSDTIPLASYSWTGPSGFNSVQQNPFIPSSSTNNAGNYIVTASVLGCQSPPDSIFVAVTNCFPDTDGDGITDEYDLDDDNDGITDVVECGAGSLQNLIVNGGFEQPAIAGTNVGYYDETLVPGWETTSTDNTIEMWANNFNGVPAYGGNQHAEINYTQFSALYQDVPTTPGDILLWYCAHRGRLGTDVMEVRIGDPNGVLIPQGQYSTGNTAWAVYSGTYIVPGGQTTSRFAFQAVSSAGGNPGAGNFLDDVTFYNVNCFADNDGDGIPNSLDLDSDNDGIYDLVEAGHGAADTNNDGRIDGTNAQFGANGLFNAIETSDNITGTTTYTVKNTDNAGPYDFLSLNSDGDTCYDVIEAGYTSADGDGLLGNGPVVVNANGLVTNATTGYTTPASNTANGFDFQNTAYNACQCHIVYTTTVDTAVCSGTVYTLPDNTTTTLTGTYLDTLQTAAGCDSIITTNLTVHLRYAFTVTPTICPNDFYTLPDGTTTNVAGTYVDTLQSMFGCDSIITTNLSVATISLDAGSNTAICPTDSAQLNATGGFTYSWTPATGLSNAAIANPKASPAITTTYTVTSQIQIGNSIANGDFSSGNTGFSSSYNYTTSNATEGEYYVGPNAAAWNGGMAGCGDHTTGSGNMLCVNGATSANVSIYCETVTVQPNTTYAFSTWLMTLSSGNEARLQFSINGSLLGNVFTAPTPTCVWQQFYSTWNSGNSTTANICIVNQNTNAGANDFALDDISFSLICTATDTVIVVVNPTYNNTVNAAICQNQSYTLPDGTVTTTNGTYVDTLTTINGCDSIITTNLTVNPTYAVAVFDTICANQNYTLPSGNTANTTGVYIDTLATINGCDSVITTNLTVKPVSATTVNDTICFGASYTLPNGNAATTTGTYPVTLTNQFGCDSVITTNLTVIKDSLTIQKSNVLCNGENSGSIAGNTQAGLAPYNYDLVLGGATISSNNTGSFSALVAGNYTINVTDAFGCSASGNALITEPALLSVTDSVANVHCFGESNGLIVLSATGGTPGYSFNLNNQSTNTSGVFSSLSAGNFAYTVTDVNGCFDTASAVITEPQALTITLNPDSAVINLGEVLQLNATSNYDPGATYQWTPNIGLSCYTCPNPVAETYNSLNYTVEVTTTINGFDCSAQTSLPVVVIPNYDIFIPNSFTPNGDGNNDLFQIFGNLPALKFLAIEIYDRIGEKVFESNDLRFTWDGNYKGRPAQPGVFVYTLRVGFIDNHSEKIYKGSLTLLK